MTVKFTGAIVGGPHDGMLLSFEGPSKNDEEATQRALMSNNCKLEFQDHLYRVTEFDKDTMRAVLLW